MNLVDEWSQIRENLDTLNSYRQSSDRKEREFFKGRIGLGSCFVALETEAGLIFGPSRFLGYTQNDRHQHEANPSKDGRDTNVAIGKILGPHRPNENLERLYLRFCTDNDIIPTRYKRKFWFVSERR